MAIAAADKPQVIYLVERAPVHVPPPPTWIDTVRHVAGIALVFLGLTLLLGASLTMAGCFTGLITKIGTKAIHPFFMTGIACAIGGFHLSKVSTISPSLEITAGPLAVTL